jgi:hypothetical protein
VVPSILYKYTSSSTTQVVLQNGTLRWSSPRLFNDLAEFQRIPRFSPTIADAHRLLPQVIMDSITGVRTLDEDRLSASMMVYLRLMRTLTGSGMSQEFLIKHMRHEREDADMHMESVIREFVESLNIDQSRVLCLTPRFDNEVMWGTYADSHAGCALGFRHIPHRSTPLQEARKVNYSEKPPIAGSGLDFMLYGNTTELRARTMESIFFSKKSHWSYEEEWRVLTWRPGEIGQTYGAMAITDSIQMKLNP